MTFRRLALAIAMAMVSMTYMASAAWADAITVTNIVTLHDETDQMFIANDQGSDTLFNAACTRNEDYCFAVWSNGSVVSATGPSGEAIPQDGTFHATRVDEPGGGQSDMLLIYASGNFAIQFLLSDMPNQEGGSADGDYFNRSGYPELTPIVETGLSQLASTITWSDGRVDQFYFVSDVAESVPEPASLLLLGTGLVVGARRWRERKTNA